MYVPHGRSEGKNDGIYVPHSGSEGLKGLIYVYLSLQHMCERSGIMKKPILNILRKQYLTLIAIKLLKISQ